MTPLERACRAMCEARGEDGFPILNADPDLGDYPLTREGTSDLCPFTEADVLTLARAVLQAIREPSEAMISVAEDREKFGYDPLPSETFPAMIDAALEEG
ncbi:hypothetical protein LH128_05173 [Sphingomonas sp. LH128]|uniref:hypothetical protein n=1 Tax=Sphingomonas sp. LH128 TaxID=473781 RepID=UPI00027C9B16|nr:hypothetical protein [Sphingomonas sp. LH128]EJU14123.1 hypothetical protein LH128_05173 [Sphingomonas sp. LH128]